MLCYPFKNPNRHCNVEDMESYGNRHKAHLLSEEDANRLPLDMAPTLYESGRKGIPIIWHLSDYVNKSFLFV